MNQIFNKIKEHWKVIFVIILCLLYVGSCTKSCNKSNEIRTKNTIITQKDSVITELNIKNDSLYECIKDLNHQLDIKNVIIDEKQKNVNSLENANKRITVKIDTVKRK